MNGDILESKSRVMPSVIDKKHYDNVLKFLEVMSLYKEVEDLLRIGAYVAGNDPKLDYAIHKYPSYIEFLKQKIEEKIPFNECLSIVEKLVSDYSF